MKSDNIQGNDHHNFQKQPPEALYKKRLFIKISQYSQKRVFREEQVVEEFIFQEQFWLVTRMGRLSQFTEKHGKMRLTISKIQNVNCKSLIYKS